MTQLACRPPIKMMIDDIQETRVLVDSLLKTKHYQRLGPEGIFAIIQKAKATNVNPLDALSCFIASFHAINRTNYNKYFPFCP